MLRAVSRVAFSLLTGLSFAACELSSQSMVKTIDAARFETPPSDVEASPQATVSPSSSASASPQVSTSPRVTPKPSATPSPLVTPTPVVSPTPAPVVSPTPIPNPTPTPTPTPVASPPTNSTQIARLVLVDGSSNQDLLDLVDGTVISRDDVSTTSFNVRAEAVSGVSVGSISFALDNLALKTEATGPYYLFGDVGGDPKGEALATGAHRLVVTLKNSAGVSANALTVNFTIVAATTTPQPTPTPTPQPTVVPSPPPQPTPGPVGVCSCERPELAPGVAPNSSNVGSCGAMRTPAHGSDVKIDDAFIRANGNSRVVDGIEVKEGIEIHVDDVVLCNFKAKSVKIMDNVTGVTIQDGDLGTSSTRRDDHPSNFVVFRRGSSGTVKRVKASGGTADAIRVTRAAAGGTQEISQSYFFEIAKYRDGGAHPDFIQVWPTVDDGSFNHIVIRQNYFHSALYGGTDSGFAVNAAWMAIAAGNEFSDNFVDRVNIGLWFMLYRTNPQHPIYVMNNLFNPVVNPRVRCYVAGASDDDDKKYQPPRLYQDGNRFTDGRAINDCQAPAP